MPGSASGLLYKDQETAELMADHHRGARIDLLDKLATLNESLDSLALHTLIEQERKALRP